MQPDQLEVGVPVRLEGVGGERGLAGGAGLGTQQELPHRSCPFHALPRRARRRSHRRARLPPHSASDLLPTHQRVERVHVVPDQLALNDVDVG